MWLRRRLSFTAHSGNCASLLLLRYAELRTWLLHNSISGECLLCRRACTSRYCTAVGSDRASVGGGVRNGIGLLNVVLVSPLIPGNTGAVARTCAASAVNLHLVEPLGYKVDDTKLKRAGLDYWPYVVVKIHPSWEEFKEHFHQQDGEKRLVALTKSGKQIHSEFSYRPGDWLIFGSETAGLPPDVWHDCESGNFCGGTVRIPIVDTYVRCLNLSVSVGIALYEASRQLNYEQFNHPTESSDATDKGRLFLSEDIYA